MIFFFFLKWRNWSNIFHCQPPIHSLLCLVRDIVMFSSPLMRSPDPTQTLSAWHCQYISMWYEPSEHALTLFCNRLLCGQCSWNKKLILWYVLWNENSCILSSITQFFQAVCGGVCVDGFQLFKDHIFLLGNYDSVKAPKVEKRWLSSGSIIF